MLVSANALSLWRRDAVGLRQWSGFDRRMLRLIAQHPVSLDSGGFVASVLYRGSPFTVPQYMELCAAALWQWFASLDMTCEPETAADEETVRDRIAGTVRLNREAPVPKAPTSSSCKMDSRRSWNAPKSSTGSSPSCCSTRTARKSGR